MGLSFFRFLGGRVDDVSEPIDPLGFAGRIDDTGIHLHIADNFQQFIIPVVALANIEGDHEHRFENAHAHDVFNSLGVVSMTHADALVFQIVDAIVISRGGDDCFLLSSSMV
jgi:hypothetical protein